MPAGEAVALAILAAGLLHPRRRWLTSLWIWLGVACVGVLAISIIANGVRWAVVMAPASASITLAAMFLAALAWAQVLGLPRAIGLPLGIGLGSRELRFNNEMARIIDVARKELAIAQSEADRRAAAGRALDREARRLRALVSPDQAWARLRDDFAAELACPPRSLRWASQPSPPRRPEPRTPRVGRQSDSSCSLDSHLRYRPRSWRGGIPKSGTMSE
jgi:hypothetical protein